MSMTTRFRERMAGPVAPLRESDVGRVPLDARGPTVGAGVVEAAQRASGSAHLGRSAFLDLDGLVLAIDRQIDDADGYRATVVAGTVTGIHAEADGPVVSGFADLLYRGPGAERRMYYRLVVGGPDAAGRAGWFVVEGIKVVTGSRWAAWRQTTTLSTRVSRLPAGLEGDDAVCHPDRPVRAVTPVSAGILRIRPRDLARQVLSMRGGVPLFLIGFFRRVADRTVGDTSTPSDETEG